MNDRSIQDSSTALTERAAQRPERLTQAREAAGLHIAALAAALKVPVKKLEALEAGRYDELPDLVFARALASSACRQLKVDPAPVLAQIPASLVPQLGDADVTVNTPFKSADAMGLHAAGWLSRPAVFAAIGLVLAALVLVFVPDMSAPPKPASGSAVATPAVTAAPAVQPAAPSLPDPAVLSSAAAPVASTATADAPPVLPAPLATDTAATVDPRKLLFIRATGESWVQVVDGAGVVLIQRMFKAGDVVDFSATPPYQVVLGRVDSAEVWVRGQAFDATPFARNSVARFEVK